MIKAIVSGHSRGLGAAIVEALLARQLPVLGLALSALPARAGLSQCTLDLADPAALTAWLAGPTLHDWLADASAVWLVNNAGQVQPIAALGEQDPQAIVQAINLNVTAPLLLSNAVLAASPHCVERRLLHVSSGAARHAYPGWSVYCASKAALDHHAQAVAAERHTGVRLVSLAPGVIDTEMQADIRAASLAQFPLRERFDALKANGQLTSPQTCAEHLVAALAHPAFGEVVLTDLRHG